jgi:hypothetical protein
METITVTKTACQEGEQEITHWQAHTFHQLGPLEVERRLLAVVHQVMSPQLLSKRSKRSSEVACPDPMTGMIRVQKPLSSMAEQYEGLEKHMGAAWRPAACPARPPIGECPWQRCRGAQGAPARGTWAGARGAGRGALQWANAACDLPVRAVLNRWWLTRAVLVLR